MHSTEDVNNDSNKVAIRYDSKISNLQENHLNHQDFSPDSSNALKRVKYDAEKSSKSIKLSENAPNEIRENVSNDKNPVNGTSQESVKDDLNQATTLIFENGTNCLQFQFKPEINTNSQITLKVLPITSNDSVSFINQQQQQQQKALNANQLQQINNSTKTLLINGSNTISLSSGSLKNNQQSCLTSLSSVSCSSNISNNSYLNNNKKIDENNNCFSIDRYSNNNNLIEQTNKSTLINLNDSDSSVNNFNNITNGNIYFMMQTPNDLVTTPQQLKSQIKTSSSSSSSSSSPPPQMPNNNINNNNEINNKMFTQTLTMNKSLNINELTNIPINSNNNNNNNNNGLITYSNNSPISSSSSSTSSNSSINSPNASTKIVRDERRRANHNEVERRRRDNINKWIVELSKVIPDCSNNHSKHGQSKGGILEKTVQYLSDIKQTNQHLADHIQSLHQLRDENELLKQQNDIYKKENEFFKSKFGIKEINFENNSATTSMQINNNQNT